VRVGQYCPIGAHDESGAESSGRALTGPAAEELLENVGWNSLDYFRLHCHDRGRYTCYRIRNRGPARRADGGIRSLDL
jgi:hypothetical protein